MSDRVVKVVIAGEAAGGVRAFTEVSLAADEAAGSTTKSMDHAGSKIGGMFEKLGQSINNNLGFGGGAFSKFGASLDKANTKGKKFGAALSELGKGALIGGVAGLAAFAGESVHLADEFDVAQAQLRTAVGATGKSFDALSGHFKKAYDNAANFGFTQTETAQALTMLTTATKSPTKAIKDLGLAMNLARFRHEDLATASQQLTTVFGGNLRAVKQLGLNLNIGSASLHSVQSATMTLTTAQRKLKQIQQSLADGSASTVSNQKAIQSAHNSVTNATLAETKAQYHLQVTQQQIAEGLISPITANVRLTDAQMGVTSASARLQQAQTSLAQTLSVQGASAAVKTAKAHDELLNAQIAVRQDALKLKQSQDAIPKVLQAITDKTKGAANAYGKTLAGQLDVAKSKLSNLAILVGEKIIPIFSKMIGWLDRNTGAFKAIAIVIGGVLSLAIGKFLVDKGRALVKWYGDAGKAMEKMARKWAENAGLIKKKNEEVITSNEDTGTSFTGEATDASVADTEMETGASGAATKIGASDAAIETENAGVGTSEAGVGAGAGLAGAGAGAGAAAEEGGVLAGGAAAGGATLGSSVVPGAIALMAGYQIGGMLNKKFGLSNSIAGGLFGGAENAQERFARVNGAVGSLTGRNASTRNLEKAIGLLRESIQVGVNAQAGTSNKMVEAEIKGLEGLVARKRAGTATNGPRNPKFQNTFVIGAGRTNRDQAEEMAQLLERQLRQVAGAR